MEPLEMIQKCRDAIMYSPPVTNSVDGHLFRWALEHLDAHEEVERKAAAIHPLDDMAYGHIEHRLYSRRKYTKSLYQRIFGDSTD